METEPRKLKIAVIGTGASGILAVIKLRELGQNDIRVFEKASDMGGTWRDNRYPGIACDVPSHLYRFSFEPNAEWTRTCASGPEIWNYLRDVYERHDIGRHVIFDAEVMKATYGEGCWTLETRAGTFGPFDVVITAMGILRYPLYPQIEGLSDFAGPALHSARWDPAVELDGKRVGVIGCGSTGTQIIPAIIDRVQQLELFQRTPQWIMPLPNPPISEEDKELFRADPQLMQQRYEVLAHEFNSKFAAAVVGQNDRAYARMVERCQANLENSIADPALREKLRPDYKVGCRRLVMSDGFYDAIQKPNAAVVTEGIERIEPGGVRTGDGHLHELDVLILATGYDAHAGLSPMKVTGKDGLDLEEAWQDGARAYLGVTVPGFPNWFMIGGPNSPIGNFSFIMTAETQMNYIAGLVEMIASGQADAVMPKGAAMESFYEAVNAQMAKTIWATGCRNWYMNKKGEIASWPWTFEHFQNMMAHPQPEDFDLLAGEAVRA
ncbi:MAG: NAD(P)/FAD-dependent oxidoreductase [Sphingobium sp.]